MRNSWKYIPNRGTSISWFLLMMLIVMAAGTFDVQAQPSGYSYYKTVTVNAAQVSGTQTNFPVLVSFSDSNLRSVANGKVE